MNKRLNNVSFFFIAFFFQFKQLRGVVTMALNTIFRIRNSKSQLFLVACVLEVTINRLTIV